MIAEKEQVKAYTKEEKAVEIALKLWPELSLTKRFSVEDRHDIDAFWLDDQTIQIKADLPMLRKGNFLWQNSYISNDTRLRVHIKERASLYVHVCWNFDYGFALMFPSAVVTKLTESWIEMPIKDGTFGFLIGIDELPPGSYKKKEFSLPL